jgi:hypothetical protein
MRASSENLNNVLHSGGFAVELLADVYYGATRRFENLPVDTWELKWNSDDDIKASGQLTVAYSSDIAESLTPKEFTDLLAPFGQQVNVRLRITANEDQFSETLQMGWFRIESIPEAVDQNFSLLGRTLTVGSRVTVNLQDRMLTVKRAGFHSEQNPKTKSCWGELSRITGEQLLRSVPDTAVPASLVYEATEGGVLKAAQSLANALGGVPYFTPDGSLSVLPDENGPVVAVLEVGERGTVVDAGLSMDSDGVFNCVVGNFEDDDHNPIYAVAKITDGPLSVDGEYGEYVMYYSSEFVKTQAQANSATQAVLTQNIASQSYRVPVQCILDPRIEDGDVVTVQRTDGSSVTGRVMSHALSSGSLMDLEVQVSRDMP